MTSRWTLIGAFALALLLGTYLKAAARSQALPSGISTQSRLPYADDGPPERGTFPVHWSDGTNCGTEPHVQVHAYNSDLFILRQTHCSDFEAPFLYLIFGDERALLIDTGSFGNPPVQMVVGQIVQSWLLATGTPSIELVVAHSHSHADHVQGDGQFVGMPNTTLVMPTGPAMRQFFGFSAWPNEIVSFDLGGRVLDVLPTPGHQGESITFYDRRTDILFAGDTVHPGHLFTYSANPAGWPAWVRSLELLEAWSRAYPVRWVLGSHVEMTSTPGVPFTYVAPSHPNERVLQLGPESFFDILRSIRAMGSTPTCVVRSDYVIHPVFDCGLNFP